MTLKYRHTDGTGQVCVGMTAEELAAQSWCAEVFGELERELLANEQINPNTGAIENIPLTAEQLARLGDLEESIPRLQAVYALTEHDYRAELEDLGTAGAIAKLADDVHKLTVALSLVLGEIRQQ